VGSPLTDENKCEEQDSAEHRILHIRTWAQPIVH